MVRDQKVWKYIYDYLNLSVIKVKMDSKAAVTILVMISSSLLMTVVIKQGYVVNAL